eukprot:tig00001095_g7017.t1
MTEPKPPAAAQPGQAVNPAKTFVPRVVCCNNGEENAKHRFVHNSITTSKYTWYNFLPKNLFLQFMRIANFYFLVIACIQLVPKLSPISPWTSIMPLLFVLSVTAVKEAVEDVRRHRSDRETNSRAAEVLRGGAFQTVSWREIVVGDLVRVSAEQPFPADLVLVSSSEPSGMCYIETSNLDGETNLKIRQGLQATSKIRSEGELSVLRGVVECEQPNNSLYTFEGAIELVPGTKIPLNPTQILLRGARLRNTHFVHGLAIFTGVDTKLMRNSTRAVAKRSHLERIMNKLVMMIFGFQMTLCAFCCLMSGLWIRGYVPGAWYLRPELRWEDAVSVGFMQFPTFVILFNVMIPISLYVSAELVKLAQAYFIQQDEAMYHGESDQPALARTSNLNEELGQVEYVFSDKTGTLTCNVMEFRKCCVAGLPYEFVASDDATVPAEDARREADARLRGALEGKGHASERLRAFFALLALCHTVIPEEDPKNPGRAIYQAASPDDGALVSAARDVRFEFVGRTPDSITVREQGREVRYELLNVLEFTSARKRMSVIVRAPDGRIRLLCKGADNVVLARLRKGAGEVEATVAQLRGFAGEGLRTLVLAEAELGHDEYHEWNKAFYAASVALEGREAKLEEAAELIERDLALVGATAIEDKLQEGVPETIRQLQRAGCKVWMLTGDKQETAVNIGLSCQLVQAAWPLVLLDSPELEETRAQLERAIEYYGEGGEGARALEKTGAQLGLVIEGGPLRQALEQDGALALRLLHLASMCRAVICCRVSPIQKALVVRLVRENSRAITLAIGDGANDVSMIQAAHIGIGISGREGMQAVMSSDYAIAQFRFLQRLLLVHGRWAYHRVSKLILYCFYKNVCFALCQFWFAIQSGFSGQTIFDSGPYATYNVIFTSLPILVFAALDQDVPARCVLRRPRLYELGLRNQVFNPRVFAQWFALGIFHSAVCFYVPLWSLCKPAAGADGVNHDGIWEHGMVVYTCIILTVTLKVAVETSLWTPLAHVTIWGSIAVWFLFAVAFSLAYLVFGMMGNVHWVFLRLLASGPFYVTLLLTLFVAALPDLLLSYLKRTFWPTPVHVVQEMVARGTEAALRPDDEAAEEEEEEPGASGASGRGEKGRDGGGGGGGVAVRALEGALALERGGLEAGLAPREAFALAGDAALTSSSHRPLPLDRSAFEEGGASQLALDARWFRENRPPSPTHRTHRAVLGALASEEEEEEEEEEAGGGSKGELLAGRRALGARPEVPGADPDFLPLTGVVPLEAGSAGPSPRSPASSPRAGPRARAPSSAVAGARSPAGLGSTAVKVVPASADGATVALVPRAASFSRGPPPEPPGSLAGLVHPGPHLEQEEAGAGGPGASPEASPEASRRHRRHHSRSSKHDGDGEPRGERQHSGTRRHHRPHRHRRPEPDAAPAAPL